MKVNYKLAALASTATALLLGMIPVTAQTSLNSKPEQLIAMCRGGGYPVLVCEIINGKKVCHRECPNATLKA
jgi:hypothetical protein